MVAAMASVGLHLLFLSGRFGDDEGGFAMVAHFAGRPGSYLYGPQWVDRPPVLILVFAVADHFGPYGVRLMATAVATVLVVAAGYAAAAVRGRRAAGWAAWATLAFSASSLLQAERLNGELIAATFVMVSMAVLLHAGWISASRRRIAWLAVLSGAAATAALFTKQNFVDGLVFAVVLCGAGILQRRTSRVFSADRSRLIAGAYVAGALGMAAAVLGWAQADGKLSALLYAMFGFRADAAVVMARWSWSAPLHRLEDLGALALVSGLALVVGLLAVTQSRRLTRRGPVAYAVAAAFGVELLGVLGGGNFWSHYLLALVPTTALASGLVAAGQPISAQGRRTSAWWTRELVVLALLAMLLPMPWAYQRAHGPEASYDIGRWIAASAAPGDTVTVLYTHANLVEESGLAPAYPYSWSLPIRTLDPHLDLLVATLNGPRAPTWVVRWDPPHLWRLDPGDRVRAALENHYVAVARFGRHTVWLHDARSRQLAPLRAVHLVPATSMSPGAESAVP